MEEKTKNYSTLKLLLWTFYCYIGYYSIYHALMLNTTIWRYYLRYYRSFTPTIPEDAPVQIRDAKEVFSVHTFEDTLPYVGDEVVIFRNYTNCAKKFEEVIYPRKKDHIDDVEEIEMLEKPGNVYIAGVRRLRKTLKKTLTEILEEQSSDYFGAFLRIFKLEDMKFMLDAKEDAGFTGDSTLISHFDRDIVSTSTHGDNWLHSYSLQCYGAKSFLFHDLPDLAKYGFNPISMIHGALASGTPDTINKIPTVRAVIYPGDLLYFAPMIYHAVAATKGKNVMFSIKRIDKKSLWLAYKRNHVIFVQSFYRMIFRDKFYKRHKEGFYIGQKYMPFFDEYREEVYDYRVKAGFEEYDGLADFGLPK